MVFGEMDPAVDVGLDSVREQRVQGRHREAVLRHFYNFFCRSKVDVLFKCPSFFTFLYFRVGNNDSLS